MIKKISKSISRLLVIIIIFVLVGAGAVFSWRSLSSNSIYQYLTTNFPLLRAIPTPTQSDKQIAFKFAVLSDTHQDTQYFPQLANEITQQPVDFVAHLGDLTDAGDKNELLKAKAILDTISQPVYVLPGDHDLNWFPEHDLTNYRQVFKLKQTYYSIDHQGIHFIFIDNSDLNNGLDDQQWQWLESDLKQHANQTTYVFMSTPLSNPYISYKAMGGTNDNVKQQAIQLGQLLNKYPVRAIFAGDTHSFAAYTDQSSGLQIITVGAAGSTKNLLPLYVIVEIFTDGSYNAVSQPYQHTIPVTGSD